MSLLRAARKQMVRLLRLFLYLIFIKSKSNSEHIWKALLAAKEETITELRTAKEETKLTIAAKEETITLNAKALEFAEKTIAAEAMALEFAEGAIRALNTELLVAKRGTEPRSVGFT